MGRVWGGAEGGGEGRWWKAGPLVVSLCVGGGAREGDIGFGEGGGEPGVEVAVCVWGGHEKGRRGGQELW